jgi:hydrogenase 3 maturation protease
MNILLGIGNILRGDDGAGSYLARIFYGEGWVSIDGGTMPENFTSVIRKKHPSLLALVDAADMGLPPGEFRRIPLDRVADVSLGTHGASLTSFISYVSSFVDEVIFIGIQPETIHDSPSLSHPVKKAADRLKILLQEEGIFSIPCLSSV